VKAESEINTVEDLRGKRVGIAHGSWQTTLLLFALDQAGLTWSDIVPVDTDVRGGGADLVDGTIDAWVGAYPGLTDIEANHELRTLIATDGLFSHPSLWFTRRDFADTNPEALQAIIEALQESDAWIEANPREAAQVFVDDVEKRGGSASLDAWEAALRGRPFGVNPVTDEFLDEQQRAADLLLSNGLLPKAVTVREAVVPWISEFVGSDRSSI
ncbi:ABC transporter substrate-binding protein, partial [Streptomyces collinus]